MTLNFGEKICKVRRERDLTQDELAQAVGVSYQSVSKWETGTCFPDTQTLPLMADYFGVSVDFLFYGKNIAYDEIYEKVYDKVKSQPLFSREAYEAIHTAFAHAHHGLMQGEVATSYESSPKPFHITGENGVSVLSSLDYGVILTWDFFKNITLATAEYAEQVLPVLADKNCFLVCMAIVSMSDISYNEIKEELGLDDEVLRKTLDELIASKFIVEKKSKHKFLGMTYDITSMCYSFMCIIMSTVEIMRYGLTCGIECIVGYGDFPIVLK